MYKPVLVACIALAGMMSVTACRVNTLRGEGAKTDENRQMGAFSAVDVDIPVKTVINVQAGAPAGVELKGYANVIKHIKTKVKDNTMYITSDLDDTWEMDCDGVSAIVTLPAISALDMSGAPDADIHGDVQGAEFKLSISGAGKAIVDNLNVDKFSTDISGAGKIEVRGGHVRSANYEISGAGKIIAFPLETQETTTSISGAGKGEVTALQQLTVNISGAGKILYKGHPKISQDVSGAGTVADANNAKPETED